LTLIGTHLLAIPDDKSRCPQREAQAAVLGELVKDAINKGDEVIVMGDMNDYSDVVLDSNNNKPISATLRILRDSGNLKNVANMVDQQERYSDWYDRSKDCVDHGGDEHSLIDHQLASPLLYSKLKSVTINHSYENHCLCLYSDHWPIIATYDFGSQGEEGVEMRESR
jgi:exonuclease III